MARESTIGTTFSLQKMAGTTSPITAVTFGATTVVTTALAAVIPGDFVVIKGTGVAALDRLAAHRCSAASAGTITLNTDTTGIVATVTTGTAAEITSQDVCFAEFGATMPEPGEVDVTTMCDTTRKVVAGLANLGSATFGGPYDIADLGVQELIKAFKTGDVRTLVWKTRGGQSATMAGVVASFMANPPSVEAAVVYTGSFQIQDGPYYLPILP